MKRAAFIVEVDLDPIPGVMDTKESALAVLRSILDLRISHYNPVVHLVPAEFQPRVRAEVRNDEV